MQSKFLTEEVAIIPNFSASSSFYKRAKYVTNSALNKKNHLFTVIKKCCCKQIIQRKNNCKQCIFLYY